jgi:hypothetical protein
MQDARATLLSLGLVDPVAPRNDGAKVGAQRLRTLQHARAGLLDNRKGNAAPLLKRIGELLVERYGIKGTYSIEKLTYSRPASAEILQDLRSRCDFVITAVGD